ncbi:MAG: BrnA antitoxin family protein [Desulfovibrio sp.]|jgi:uncharacterized protein (DUF4415 family)|nr:BrnA antitoxin family protein [Desulfovibrio sp.]
MKICRDGLRICFSIILDKKDGITQGFTPQEIERRTPEMQRLRPQPNVRCKRRPPVRSGYLPKRRKEGHTMAIITSTVKVGQKPSEQERKLIRDELREAQERHINLDDCPELSPDALKEFAVLRAEKNRLRKRQIISVRLSPSYIEKYKTLGKGYTGVMADVLAYAADHPEILFQSAGAHPVIED